MMEGIKAMSEPLKVLSNEKPWYSEGLRFKCTECGQCCTGGPGYAWVTKEEIETIASHLGMTVKDFGKRYLRSVYGRYSLVEKKETCQIYQVRPTQCRTFPWWAENLKSPEAWKEAAKHCEGISCDAPVVPFEEIQPQLERDVTGEGL